MSTSNMPCARVRAVSLEAEINGGWIVRAREKGLRVTSRSEPFGGEGFVVKRGGAHITFKQAKCAGRRLDTTGFTPEQLSIVEDLKGVGILVPDR